MGKEDIEKSLVKERDFLSYLRLLKKASPKYIIIIAVCDTGAADYFTPECADMMMDLGLKINMVERYRQPYIAIIENGNILVEKVSENTEVPLYIEGSLNDHTIQVYSAGFNYQHGIGCGAMVLIDGADYLVGGRGFNFLVFDKKQDRIVDSCAFDTFNMGRCKRNENPISEALLSFSQKGIQICFISFPRFPSKYNLDVSTYERFIIEKKFEMVDIMDSKIIMKEVWDNQQLPFASDYETFEDFYEVFHTPTSSIGLDGNRRYLDYASRTVNTRNGIRVTLHQPKDFRRAIFFVGNCRFYGWGATDACTPASLLQKQLNLHPIGKDFIVYNYAQVGNDTYTDLLCTLRNLPLQQGDIVFFQDRVGCTAPWGIPYCDLRLKSVRPHNYGEIFIDSHTSHNGNRMIADGIFDFLKKNDFFQKNLPADLGTPIHVKQSKKEDEDEPFHDYKEKLRTFYRKKLCPKIGSVVMNCNPFTNGHRYLVEQALEHCDHLIVFVVEEDKSVFPFADRIALVRKSIADLKNVSVIPSGQFIISTRTFQEYFNKEFLQEQVIDTTLDVTMFAKEIAPCLNISMRFAGEEPLDNVTRQYNENMARLLPKYGIKFVEIPRLKFKGAPISASEVRRLAEAREFEQLKNLVPLQTLYYLRNFQNKSST